MADTLTYAGQLTVEICWCGMRHAIPIELWQHMKAQHDDGREQTAIYCPLGHSWIISGESKVTKIGRQLDETQAQLVAARDQLAAAEREASRARKRAAKGICPCCKRSFANVARHVAGQHPNYAKENH